MYALCILSHFLIVFFSSIFKALGVFGLCQIHAFIDYVRSRLSREQFQILFRSLVIFAAILGLSAFGVATALGSILSVHGPFSEHLALFCVLNRQCEINVKYSVAVQPRLLLLVLTGILWCMILCCL